MNYKSINSINKNLLPRFNNNLILLMILFTFGILSCTGKIKKEAYKSNSNNSINSESIEKPRLLVLTDIGGDPDDQQSLVRLLVYANEFDIEGIVVEGWKKYSGYDQMGIAKNILHGYGEVRDNLLQHSREYPTQEYLESVLKRGALDVVKHGGEWRDYVGEGKDTEGSRHIIDLLETDDQRLLDISVWGGTADLAQALWWLRENRSDSAMSAIISQLRVHAIAHQDITGPWILKNFPELFFILNLEERDEKSKSVSPNSAFRGMYLGGDEQLTSLGWINKNVREDHGPLGALYPAKTSTQSNPHGALKEGDTPSWFYFLRNGLNDPSKPAYGGWGGRFTSKHSYYNDAEDTVGAEISARATTWRWRPHFQNSFAARMDWCVKSYNESNHHPIVSIEGEAGKNIFELTAIPGSRVSLSAKGSMDPDGDKLSYHWYIYPDVGTYTGPLEMEEAHSREAILHVPTNSVNGQTIHIVLEVTDDGEPQLTSHRRVLLTVQKDT